MYDPEVLNLAHGNLMEISACWNAGHESSLLLDSMQEAITGSVTAFFHLSGAALQQ